MQKPVTRQGKPQAAPTQAERRKLMQEAKTQALQSGDFTPLLAISLFEFVQLTKQRSKFDVIA